MSFSWVSLMVDAFVAAACIVVAFEYDRIRQDQSTPLRWYERLAMQFVVTIVVTGGVAHLFNRRVRLGDDVYSSSYHTSACIDDFCYHSSRQPLPAAAPAVKR